MVIVKNNKITTIWNDYDDMPYPYNIVAKELHKLVSVARISKVFKPKEEKYGAQITYTIDAPKKPRTFNHFYCTIPEQAQAHMHDTLHQYDNNFIPAKLSLDEISPESVETVIDLIETNNLARGEDHLHLVKAFSSWLLTANNEKDRDLFGRISINTV